MKSRILVLGAGFGGLELATLLSEALGEDVDVTLIDKSDAFVFGFSKLDVMFGRTTLDAVRLPYRDVVKPGVRFLQETVTAIDPEPRRVTTDARASTRPTSWSWRSAPTTTSDATPGLAEGGNEFYSVAGAARLARDAARIHERPGDHRRLRSAVQVPAGAERGALLLHDYLVGARRPGRLRDHVRDPVRQPGPAVAGDLERAARGLRRARHRVRPRQAGSARSTRSAASPCSTTAAELPYDLFLGVPKHRAPDVVLGERHVPRTATCPSNPRDARRPGSRASTRSATSRPSARRRRASSPRARRGSSPGH